MNQRHTVPDCTSCIHRKDCPRAKTNTFCTAWASTPATVRNKHADPNERWRRGMEVPELGG